MFKSISVAVVFALSALGSTANAQAAGDAAAAAAAAVVPVRAMGRDDAPVTIDLFQSLVCYDCGVWHRDVLPELKSRFVDTGQVRIVFHDAMTEPVMASARAGLYGLCAAPSSFFDVVDAFMKGVLLIKDGGDASAFFPAAEAVSGRVAEEFAACTNSEDTYNLLVLQNKDGRLSDFDTFPGIMVNEAAVTDVSLENLATVIASLKPST